MGMGAGAEHAARRAAGWATVCCLLLVLVACGGGTVNDARLGQARDAESSPELDPQQATFTAREFFPPTPTPTPAPPLPPTLESLAIARSVGAGDLPTESLASVPADTGIVYASALLNGVVAGQRVEAVWTDLFGNQLAVSTQEVAADAGQQWISLPYEMNGGLAPGDYAVYLFADDRRLGSLVFVVGPPGSGAQAFPPPPDNPQANAAPTAAPNNGGNRGDRRNDNSGDQPIDPVTGQPVPTAFPPG